MRRRAVAACHIPSPSAAGRSHCETPGFATPPRDGCALSGVHFSIGTAEPAETYEIEGGFSTAANLSDF
jgi:hypothetical protein